MNISKLLNSVKGGVLTVNDPELGAKIEQEMALRMKPLRASQNLFARLYLLASFFAFIPFFYSFVFWLQKKTSLLSSETDYYSDDSIELPKDYLSTPSSFQAKVGLRSMKRLDSRVEKRKKSLGRCFLSSLLSMMQAYLR